MTGKIYRTYTTFVLDALYNGWIVSRPGSAIATRGKYAIVFFPATGEVLIRSKNLKNNLRSFPPFTFDWCKTTYARGKLWYMNEFVKPL